MSYTCFAFLVSGNLLNYNQAQQVYTLSPAVTQQPSLGSSNSPGLGSPESVGSQEMYLLGLARQIQILDVADFPNCEGTPTVQDKPAWNLMSQ